MAHQCPPDRPHLILKTLFPRNDKSRYGLALVFPKYDGYTEHQESGNVALPTRWISQGDYASAQAGHKCEFHGDMQVCAKAIARDTSKSGALAGLPIRTSQEHRQTVPITQTIAKNSTPSIRSERRACGIATGMSCASISRMD